jgi:DNA modification methylase
MPVPLGGGRTGRFWVSPDGTSSGNCGDCLDVLPRLGYWPCDAVVTDPPYGLRFMGKSWDHGVPGVLFWRTIMACLRPGGYMAVMGGTRTYHRLTCAVEDAGLEIRDCLAWLYGTGFPKSNGCLKPAWEPIVLARRPGPRVLPLGVDECRTNTDESSSDNGINPEVLRSGRNGRYPTNVLHDGSDEVMGAFSASGESRSPSGPQRQGGHHRHDVGMTGSSRNGFGVGYGDGGSAARFFYCAKPSKKERGPGNTHPTVKPLALMRWLVCLVCPPGGLVLDPFAGSGTTGLACLDEGRRCVLVEQDEEYCGIIKRRLGRHASTAGRG